jgi:prolyl-tRNA synthetase
MQDGKRYKLVRHTLGQNFAKAFDVKFANAEGNRNMYGDFLGVSTRLMGALVMTHSDDQVWFPPSLAPIQVVVPIYKTDEQLESISTEVNSLIATLEIKYLCKNDNTTQKTRFQICRMGAERSSCEVAVGPKENGTLRLQEEYIDQRSGS